jgi:hypothetical protein
MQTTPNAAPDRPTSVGPSRTQVATRITASLLGGYVFVGGFASLGTVLGVRAGMSYAEAQTLLYLLAFLVFLAAFCWAFAARRALHVWLVLLGGGSTMTAAAWLWARALV